MFPWTLAKRHRYAGQLANRSDVRCRLGCVLVHVTRIAEVPSADASATLFHSRIDHLASRHVPVARSLAANISRALRSNGISAVGDVALSCAGAVCTSSGASVDAGLRCAHLGQRRRRQGESLDQSIDSSQSQHRSQAAACRTHCSRVHVPSDAQGESSRAILQLETE